MKTIFKRAAAWFLTALMILNCVPVYAQDTSVDYSQGLNMAAYLADDGVETASVDDSNKISDISVTSDSNSEYTWSIPVYYYSGNSVNYAASISVKSPQYSWYSSSNTNTLSRSLSDFETDVTTYIGSGYVFEQAYIGSAIGNPTKQIGTDGVTFEASTTRSGRYNNYTYIYALTSDLVSDLSGKAIYVEYTPSSVTATFKPGYTGGEDRPQQQVKPGELITFPEAPDRPDKEHYEFGWIASGETEPHKPGDKLTLNENKEFTGKWTPIQYTAKFNLNYDGAPPIPECIRTIEDKAPATFPTAKREGYTLLGWNTAASAASEPAAAAYDLASDEGGVTAYADGAEYEVGEEIPLATATYDAVWAADSFMVTFDYNGGYSSETDAAQTTITVGYGESFDLPWGYREEEYPVYELIGWEDEAGQLYYMDMEADATPYPGTITSDITFTAVWQATCMIMLDCAEGAFDGQPDVLLIDVSIPMGEKFLDWIDSTHEPLPPEGYIFAGWLDESTGEMITADSEVTQDTTLIAQYTEKNGYFVDFLLDGESIYKVLVPFETDLYAYINANADVKTSHMIGGSEVKLGAFVWKNSNGTDITSGQIVTEDIEVIGTLGNVTVTFYNDSTKDKQVGEVQTLPYGGTVSSFPTDELTVPNGMSFVEWRYTGTEGEVRFDSSTPVYENMQVYAHYAQMHTLTFYTDSKMTTVAGTVQVPHGEKFDTSLYPSVTVPEGQTLRYWVDATTSTPVVFNPAIEIAADMKLYPVFDKYVFVIKDKSTGDTITSVYLGALVDFTVAAEEGYYYAGIQLENGTILKTDGEQTASTTLFGVTSDPVNGQYIVYATPIFEKQLTVVYHAGEGSTILAAADGQTYTQAVDAEILMPGAMDIIRTDGTTGVALDGWATTENASAADLTASTTYTNDQIRNLDADGDGVVHLYPVWTKAEDAITITFHSNYPDGAIDASGNALTDTTYKVYIKSGSYPVMPTLERASMVTPSNVYGTDNTQRYTLSGWSVDQTGRGDNAGTTLGAYVVGSQYQVAITADEDFYAVWIDAAADEDSKTTAYFYIRSDGSIPQEPGGYSKSDYYPLSSYKTLAGSIKKPINIVNDPTKVALNIEDGPSAAEIIDMLYSIRSSLDSEHGWGYSGSNVTYKGTTLLASEYGTTWWVEWYACKDRGGDNAFNVDGRIRLKNQFQVTYMPNGGTSQNMPPSSLYTPGTTVTVEYQHSTNTDVNNGYPIRSGYTFLGWDTNPDAETPMYPVDTDQTFTMPSNDVILYAIWQGQSISLTFDGIKYMVEKDVTDTADEAFSFLVEKQNEDGSYTTLETVQNSTWDGTFSFDYEFDTEGLHTFRVTEKKGSDTNIAYDGAVYTITVYIGSDDQGLYEVGRTVMKNNVIQTNKTMEFTNRVGERIVTVTKVWDDKNDQDGIRPSSITVYLYADGVPDPETKVLDDSNGWSATWTQLPIAVNNKKITYTVQEVTSMIGYTSETTGDMDTGFTITNTHTPLTTEITVTKQWVDDSNAAKMRPDDIVLTLTGSDGSTRTATLTGTENSWTYTFTDLPVYYGGGNLVTYTLDETDVPNGYTKSVDGYTVTNTLQSGYSFTVNKNVAGNFASRTKEFSFTADILAADGKTVIRTETFALAHGGSKVITGIPYGAYVQVTEDPDGYDAQHLLGQTPAEGASYTTTTPITNNDQGVTFLNTKTAQIDTGVDLDTIPYVVMLLSIFGAGALWLIGRRRRTQN